MSYNEEKMVKLKALKQLAQRLEADYATKAELTAAVNAKLSSTYRAGGSAAFADLPGLTEDNLGLVINVTDSFTSTDSFIEGAGILYPAGTNVAVVKSGADLKYDVLAGFVDLSGYVEKVNGKGLSTEDYTTEEKDKLASVAEGATKVEAGSAAGYLKINGVDTAVVDIASDDEVTEMLSEVFGPAA